MIGKLKCWWTGKHLRRRRLKPVGSTPPDVVRFRCPRCGDLEERKVKA